MLLPSVRSFIQNTVPYVKVDDKKVSAAHPKRSSTTAEMLLMQDAFNPIGDCNCLGTVIECAHGSGRCTGNLYRHPMSYS